ncbi:transglycosylase [Kordiimonas sediminis]|uniref:Transglycosylase n=1 Tax=Kordiimonas sediminis TaxID=1735581 RepID=A0A919AL89_9PROT|nr:GlsB/YeaQ/YmgE family stress response membrane protein [Kordiimonas sediminis]GHF11207.1 transglycosylase [Kordiimonas sediminis]
MLAAIVTGGLAGFLAGHILRGRGYGVIANVVLGILGGVFGNFLLDYAGVSTTGVIESIYAATFGAVLIILIFGSSKKSNNQENQQ